MSADKDKLIEWVHNYAEFSNTLCEIAESMYPGYSADCVDYGSGSPVTVVMYDNSANGHALRSTHRLPIHISDIRKWLES
jgi:hypothetical protein